MHEDVEALIARSNRLGADRRITNFGGGNTSVKVTLDDPVTGEPTHVLVVKGSGGDLASLTEAGLATLDLNRVLALEQRFRAGVSEEEVVRLYELCRFDDAGAVPSIDTPLHAFVDRSHVDHLHPDAVIALAAAADGEALVARCFGDEVGWLEWLRPGFALGLALHDFRAAHPEARGAVLGGHGLICWGDTSESCEATSLSLVARAEQFLADRGRAEPFGPIMTSAHTLTPEERRAEASRLGPIVRGIAGSERPVATHFTDAPVVLEFLDRDASRRLAELGTSCPDHFLRTKVKPLLLDLPVTTTLEERAMRLRELHQQYRADYAKYYETHARSGSPAMRNADPAIVLVPGVGMWSFGVDPRTARVAGEFYLSSINVMRGAESVSTYAPLSDAEKFSIEYWELEERKLQLQPPPPSLSGRVAFVTGAGSGIGRAIATMLAEQGACVVVGDVDADRAEKVAAELGDDRALAVTVDVGDEASVDAAFAAAALRFGGVDLAVNNAGLAASAPLVDTTVDDWDRLHAVLARGAFLVSRAAARMMIDAQVPGDIVYIVSKNAVVAGPNNVAYGAAKADQAHQVRLLAAELGPAGIRVNGVNPDAVVRGSGIFRGDWLAQRAQTHGVKPEELGDFYAGRTLLGNEVLSEHVADAVLGLVDGHLTRTTGVLVPVDGGVTEAFLR